MSDFFTSALLVVLYVGTVLVIARAMGINDVEE